MKNLSVRIYFYLFILILILPGVGVFFRMQVIENCENRELVQAPKFSNDSIFFNRLNSYINDNIGWKTELSYCNSLIKVYGTSASIKPTKAVIGKDGFLMYSSLDDKEFSSYLHTDLFSAQELNDWTISMKDRMRFIDSTRTEYYMAICPNKSTVYPEKMPWNIAILKRGNYSKADQLIAQLQKVNIGFELIDLRNVVIKNKKKGQLYYKNDTHWNSLGAFYAYECFIHQMGIVPMAKNDFNIHWQKKYSGDLKGVMSLCRDKTIDDMEPIFELKIGKQKVTKEHLELTDLELYTNPNAKDERVVLFFRDSFGTALIPFFTAHFKKIYFIRTEYYQGLVEELKPDVVVVSKVERYL